MNQICFRIFICFLDLVNYTIPESSSQGTITAIPNFNQSLSRFKQLQFQIPNNANKMLYAISKFISMTALGAQAVHVGRIGETKVLKFEKSQFDCCRMPTCISSIRKFLVSLRSQTKNAFFNPTCFVIDDSIIAM